MSTDIIYDGFSPFTGLRSRVHFDDVEDLLHVEHIGEVEPALERNKAVYNGHGGWASDRTGENGFSRHVASIPPVAMVHLLNRGIDVMASNDDPEQYRKLNAILNDRDYFYLRTTPGRI